MLKLQIDPSSFDSAPAEKAADIIKNRFANLDGSIQVKVISAKEVQALNKKYADKDEPTDVLSFNYNESQSPDSGLLPTELGDVVISAEHVKKQSKEAGTDEATELTLLMLHGVLHLLGYDHATPADLAKMDDLQKDIMGLGGLTYRNFGWAA